MRKKEDWLIQATSAANISKGSRFTLKLKGHPWETLHRAQLGMEDILTGLRLLDYVQKNKDKGA